MGQTDDHIEQRDEDPSQTLDAGKPLWEHSDDLCVESD